MMEPFTCSRMMDRIMGINTRHGIQNQALEMFFYNIKYHAQWRDSALIESKETDLTHTRKCHSRILVYEKRKMTSVI